MDHVRTYRKKDFEALVRLCRSACGRRWPEGIADPGRLRLRLKRPSFQPGRDLFLGESRGCLTGFMEAVPERRIRRVVLSFFVRPRHRRRRIGSRMLERSLERCRQMGAVVVHACVAEDDRPSRAFLGSRGFRAVRSYLDLECDLTASHRWRIEADLKGMREGEEKALADIQNRVFSGSWGFCPNTEEEIRFFLEWTRSRLSDILVQQEGGNNIGYFWPYPVSGRRPTTVRIHMLGIDPDWRGRLRGRKLFVSGLARLKAENWKTALLTVDESNQAALRLYVSTGFRPISRRVWYETRIESPAQDRTSS